jgi:hypothetical protein
MTVLNICMHILSSKVSADVVGASRVSPSPLYHSFSSRIMRAHIVCVLFAYYLDDATLNLPGWCTLDWHGNLPSTLIIPCHKLILHCYGAQAFSESWIELSIKRTRRLPIPPTGHRTRKANALYALSYIENITPHCICKQSHLTLDRRHV